MKEFNFWCKENTDHGECANKLCDYDKCCCYACLKKHKKM